MAKIDLFVVHWKKLGNIFDILIAYMDKNMKGFLAVLFVIL